MPLFDLASRELRERWRNHFRMLHQTADQKVSPGAASIVAEGDKGVDAGGATGGEIAGE
jgi:hypothetical protein